nr:ATP synthase F0 subunit 6 [Didemnum perlucidum]
MFSMFEISLFKIMFNIIILSSLMKFVKKLMYNLLSGFFFFFKFFCIIFFMNMSSMIPYGLSITSLTTNLMLSFMVWVGMFYYYMLFNTNSNIAHFLPVGSPVFMMLILVIIETISVLMRPLSLGVRLMSNITSGHLVMHLMTEAGGLISFFLVFLIMFELFVCFIQSYIFYLLLNIYLDEMK